MPVASANSRVGRDLLMKWTSALWKPSGDTDEPDPSGPWSHYSVRSGDQRL